MEQIGDEIKGALDFLQTVYSTFNFTLDLCLSTRPESFLGDIEVWNSAEAALKTALDSAGIKWTLNPGDGAFYGPKIDISISDALRRPHQCGTIQLDFQLPIRFDLNYSAEDGTKKHPVIVHRAIFGSIERFIAIVTENFAGKWFVTNNQMNLFNGQSIAGRSGCPPDRPLCYRSDPMLTNTQNK